MDTSTTVKPQFHWDDPLLLASQLTDEERMVRDTAHAYAQDKLMPRITQADRKSTRLNSSHGKLSRMPSSA